MDITLNMSQLTMAIETVVEKALDKQMGRCMSHLRTEILAELGVSEYMPLSKAYRTYSENFIKKWRRSGKLKNAGTPKRVKFRISDLEKLSEEDEFYKIYLSKKYRNIEKRIRKSTPITA